MQNSVRNTLFSIIGISLSCIVVFESQSAPPPGEHLQTAKPEFAPGEAIVGFADDNAMLDRLLPRPLGNRTYLVKDELAIRSGVDPELATWELIERLLARDDVEYAHPNYYVELAARSNETLSNEMLQWNLQAIDISRAWKINTGNPDVRIAVIDTGYTFHPDLNGQWSSMLQYNSADESNPSAEDTGIWRVEQNRIAYWRHGTHVSSIAIGTPSSATDGTSTTGVCPGCTLLPIRYWGDTPETVGSFETLIAAIYWAVDTGGADVINLSLESDVLCSPIHSQGLSIAIEYAINNGVPVVAAAGNRPNSVTIGAPASCPGVIAVAALDQQLQLPHYSERGSQVTLAAPGGGGNIGGNNSFSGAGIGCPQDPDHSAFNPFTIGVVAAWTTSPFSIPGNAHCHRHLSGTSMATPHVAGVVGLLLSIDPSLSPADVKQILEDSASPLPGCGSNCGAGLLNAGAAVSAITDDISWLPAIISYILQ